MPDEVKTAVSTNDGSGMMGWMNDTQRGIAWFIVVAFVLLIFVWIFRPPTMQPESMAQLNQLVSTLQNILLIAFGFFFGSSKSSQNKDDALTAAALAPTPATPGPDAVAALAPAPGTKTTATVEPAAPGN